MDLLTNLDSPGYREVTPIQAQSLPLILQSHDPTAQAKTDNGEAAAFGLALLSPLNPRYFGCQALVLCPTYKLTDQVAKEVRRLARVADNIKVLIPCGGVPYGPRMASLEHGAHMVVGTPRRIQEHLRKDTLVLDGLNTLVPDEADRMLDVGFYDSIAEVIGQFPKRRQTLLFSVTYLDGIEKLAKIFMCDLRQVRVESLHADSQIEQRFLEIDPKQRMDAVIRLLQHFRLQSCVALCQTCQQCQELADALKAQRISALALYGDLKQHKHDRVLTVLVNRSHSALVATDVIARGLDIAVLGTVINVELVRNPEVRIHRIGRSGRAGEKSLALSLVAPAEANRAQAIEDLQKQLLAWYALGQLKAGPEPLLPPMSILCIAGGRKDKVRPDDLLGALTGDAGLPGSATGKIAISDSQALIAIKRGPAHQALKRLSEDKTERYSFKVRLLQRAAASLVGPTPACDITAG